MLSAFPLGPEFRANTYTTFAQRDPAVAMDADGDFVVVWTTSGDVVGQRFAASGAAAGAEFKVDSGAAHAQSAPAVAMDADGDFVITWTSRYQDGSFEGIYAQRFHAAGDPAGAEFRVNTHTTGRQVSPAVAMSDGGAFVVVWTSLNQGEVSPLYGQRYNDSGVPVAGEFLVNSHTTEGRGSATVAMNADGGFVVAWQGAGPAGNVIQARRFDPEAQPLGQEFLVHGPTSHAQSGAAAAMDADGDFVVAWSSINESQVAVLARAYDAAGAPRGPASTVNTSPVSYNGAVAVAMDDDGDYVVAWQNSGYYSYEYGGIPSDIVARRYDVAGVPRAGEFRVNTSTPSDQRVPAVATDADGDFVVAWRSYSLEPTRDDIFAQRFRPVSDGQTATLGGRVWHDSDGDGIQDPAEPVVIGVTLELINDAGAFAGGVVSDANGRYRFAVPVGEPARVRVVAPAGRILTKRDRGGDDARDSDFDGISALSATFVVASPGHVIADLDAGLLAPASISGAVYSDRNGNGARDAGEPGVPGFIVYGDLNRNGLRDPDERFGVSGESGDYVIADLVPDVYPVSLEGQDRWTAPAPLDVALAPATDVTGIARGAHTAVRESRAVPVGAEFRVNTFTPNHQNDPAVAVAADGRAVVVWASSRQDSADSYGVYAQRYDARGARVGVEFRVNTHTPGYQRYADVAMDADGDFVVVWSSVAQAAPGTGLFAQRFNADGVPQGGEFFVAQADGASIAMDPEGDFVIAWTQREIAEDSSVYARRYDAAGNPLGAATRVGSGGAPDVAVADDGRFVLAWADHDGSNFGIFARQYEADGTADGAAFPVNTFTPRAQFNASVGIDADGSFTIAWDSFWDSRGVLARRFDRQGRPQGGEFRVNTVTTTGARGPSIAVERDGDFVVAWSAAGDGDWDAVYARRYSAAGVPLGADFRVNTFTPYYENNPAIAVDADGDFIVAWQSGSQDGSSDGVYAQRFAVVPSVVSSSFLFASAPHRLRFDFDRDVSESLATSDLTVRNLTTGQTIPANQFALLYDGAYDVATFMYVGSGTDAIGGVMPDGRYRATLAAAGVTSGHGVPLESDHVVEFFFLNGDANRDGLVNLRDFNILAANFGQAGTDFARGDFTFDGTTDLRDFHLLAARFGAALAPGSPAAHGARDATRGGEDADVDDLLEQWLA